MSGSFSSALTEAEALLLAMAEIPKVLDAFQAAATPTAAAGDTNEPDAFARLLQKHLTPLPTTAAALSKSCHSVSLQAAGPSPRYLWALLQQYVRRIGDDAAEASEELLQVILLGLTTKDDNDIIPNPNESCHVSFWIPSLSHSTTCTRTTADKMSDDGDSLRVLPLLLRIRIFPYHNDVGLRIWEAGAALSEFLIQNPRWVQHQRIVELGAGTGITGLVAAGVCQAEHVFCTDYTETSLENIDYNLQINRLWLQEQRKEEISECELWDYISYGYLDWMTSTTSTTGRTNGRSWEEDDRLLASMKSMSQATVLLAADLAYDASVIGPLAQTIRYFLQGYTRSKNKKKKQALIATTLRSKETFTLLQDKISQEGITIKLEMDDCSRLPMCFPLKFVQPRSDVKIYSLTLSES